MTDAVEESTDETGTEPVEVVEVELDKAGRQVREGKYSFKVPDGHPEQGNEIKKTFPYVKCTDDSQAVATLKERKWKLRDIVNDKLKAGARSNAYQNALMPYRPSEVSQADIRARMIRDLIRSKVPEALAIKTIDMALATTTTQ